MSALGFLGVLPPVSFVTAFVVGALAIDRDQDGRTALGTIGVVFVLAQVTIGALAAHFAGWW